MLFHCGHLIVEGSKKICSKEKCSGQFNKTIEVVAKIEIAILRQSWSHGEKKFALLKRNEMKWWLWKWAAKCHQLRLNSSFYGWKNEDKSHLSSTEEEMTIFKR